MITIKGIEKRPICFYLLPFRNLVKDTTFLPLEVRELCYKFAPFSHKPYGYNQLINERAKKIKILFNLVCICKFILNEILRNLILKR